MEQKKFWLSKTFWANIVVPMIAFLNQDIAEFISKNPEGAVMFWGAINVVLRFFTKDKVTLI